MIYEGKEEPIDKIDFDIVDNEMEEEVENENENTMVANEEEDDDDDDGEDEDDDDDDDNEDYETPEIIQEKKIEEGRKKREALQQQRELLQRDKEHEISVEDYLSVINVENGSSSYRRSKRDDPEDDEDDDNKIDYNPPLYYGLIASLYDLYTLRYPIQKKWYRPFSDNNENRPIINTIVEYRRRKIVRRNIDKTRRFQMCYDITGVQSLCCIILLSMNHSIVY